MKVLITSIGTATGVNLIKYFKKMEDVVIGTDINEIGMTAGSMLVDKFIRVPTAIETNYIDVLETIINEESIDVFIPINDIEVYVVSKNIDRIKCECVIPDKQTIEELRDKYICSSEVAKIGVSVPAILTTDNINQKRILRDKIGVGSKGVAFYDKGSTCPNFDKGAKFLQACVAGREFTVDVLANRNGEPIYIIPRERIEVKSGVATKVRITNDVKIIKATEEILKRFKIPGFSNIQFIKDDNGTNWFIEVNYRFSGCGAATLATCNDYLEKFKKIILNQNLETRINDGVKWDAIVTRYYEECVYETNLS